jgi:transcriptional regulator with XRE-family HTH domain
MQRHGYSQRAIAALIGITRAEVSEIVSRRRRVLVDSMPERLTNGLRLPRSWVGLAFDDVSHPLREDAYETVAADLCQPTARYAKDSRTARHRARTLLATSRGRARTDA